MGITYERREENFSACLTPCFPIPFVMAGHVNSTIIRKFSGSVALVTS